MSALDDIQGEQGLDEVNGGNRAYTRWERFLCGVQVVFVILFLAAAWPIVDFAMTNLGAVR